LGLVIEGKVGIGNTIPNNTLDVSGNVNVSGILHASGVNVSGTVEATTFIGSGASLTGISSVTPPWNSSGTNVYLNDSTAKVGIGTTNPTDTLTVIGTLNITGNVSLGTNDVLFVDNTSSRVGIGDITPSDALEVIGNVRISGSLNASSINTTGSAYFATSGVGKVGIGTISPGMALDIVGNVSIKGNLSVDSNLSVDGNTFFVDSLSNRVGVGTTGPYNTLTVIGSVGVSGSLNASSINTTGSAYFATVSGNVGVGTTDPNDALDVNGSGLGTTETLKYLLRVGNATNDFLVVNASTGYVGIGTGGPTHQLHVVGHVNITENLYLGQNLTDLAEMIFSLEDVEAGDVVVISDDMKVIKSYKGYDKKAVGVISTAPAATFGGNKGNVPLAISGRVPVKVIDENGHIEPGDLLTTSSTSGHAMKCDDYEKCFGNIIGKAITPLEGRQGVVTMMIMLN